MKRTLVFLYALGLITVVGLQSKSARQSERFEREEGNTAAEIRWNNARLRDPATGEIPRGIRQRELAFANTLPSDRVRGLSDPTIYTTTFNHVGPMNVGGRTQAIAIDVANENNILLASAQGGLWRSRDKGMTWGRSTASDQLKDITSLAQDKRPGKANTWYCGTGELLSTTNRRIEIVTLPRWRTLDIGDGIYKSTDSGASWQLLPSTFDPTVTVLDSAFDGVWNIVTDATQKDQDVVYAACYGAIMRSTDGGGSWTRVLGDASHKSFATDIAITSKGVLYSYLSSDTRDQGTSSTAGLWRSTDGIHWANITPSWWAPVTVRMKLAIAPSNENIVYVAGETPGTNPTEHGLYKYTFLNGDGSGKGGTWDDRSENLPVGMNGLETFNTLGGYCLTVRVHPSDPNMLFIGGTNLYRSASAFRDAGNYDWIGGYNPDPNGGQSYTNHHPDNHDLVFSPSDPHQAFSANDAGIFSSPDILANDPNDSYHPVAWADLNDHYPVGILFNVALDHASPKDETVLGGFQDQGSWVGRMNLWRQYGGGDGCYCAIADNKLAYYVSSQFGYLLRIHLDDQLNLNDYDVVRPRFLVNPQFVTPWMLDPTDNTNVYLADSNQLWRNSDITVPVAEIENNWQTLPLATLDREATISALGMSVASPHKLFYGTSDGHLYRYDDPDLSIGHVTEISSPNFPANAFISCVNVDPANVNHLLVVFSNYHVQSLFATDDGGKSWRNISGNLEEHPDGSGDGPSTRWISIVHQNGRTLYLVGTSVGLYSTTDISGPNVIWAQEGSQSIGRAIVENLDVRQSDGFVAIATQGSGVFTTSVSTSDIGPSAVGAPVAQSPIALYPNPADSKTTLSYSPSHAGNVSISVVDPTGKLHTAIFNGSLSAGPHLFTVDCSNLPNGSYYLQVRNGEAVERKRLVVQR